MLCFQSMLHHPSLVLGAIVAGFLLASTAYAGATCNEPEVCSDPTKPMLRWNATAKKFDCVSAPIGGCTSGTGKGLRARNCPFAGMDIWCRADVDNGNGIHDGDPPGTYSNTRDGLLKIEANGDMMARIDFGGGSTGWTNITQTNRLDYGGATLTATLSGMSLVWDESATSGPNGSCFVSWPLE